VREHRKGREEHGRREETVHGIKIISIQPALFGCRPEEESEHKNNTIHQ
jgi:hypothetical protein